MHYCDKQLDSKFYSIVTRLSEVEVRKWGVSKKAAQFTTKFLHNQEFSLKTTHGITEQSYKYSETSRIHGRAGQGRAGHRVGGSTVDRL